MPRGYNTKGGSNGHFNHVDPRSTFLLSSLLFSAPSEHGTLPNNPCGGG